MVELHPDDLARRGLVEGALVEVRSRRGSLVLPVAASDRIAPTQASIPMHWGEEVLGGSDAAGCPRLGINGLTLPVSCPTSKQPELKHAAVQIEPIDLPWRMLGLAWLPQARMLEARQQLRALMPAFGFALVLPFGREPHAQGLGGLLWRAAAPAPLAEAQIRQIEKLLGLDDPTVLRYQDRQRNQFRSLRLDREGEARILRGVLLAGDTRAEAWIRTLLQDEVPSTLPAATLLAAGSAPPMPVEPPSPQVCTCFNVTERQIDRVLETCHSPAEERLGRLQAELRCGTNCGSCLPMLMQKIRHISGDPALQGRQAHQERSVAEPPQT
jgi:assimilatory nitrate reductase catalytic subunit